MHVHAARLRGRTNARREGALELAVVAAEHRRCADKSVVACDGARVRVGGVAALRKVHPLKVCGSWQLTRNRCGTCGAGQQTRGRGRMCVCVCVCVRGRRGEGKKGRREEKKRRREEGKKGRREEGKHASQSRESGPSTGTGTQCARVCVLLRWQDGGWPSKPTVCAWLSATAQVRCLEPVYPCTHVHVQLSPTATRASHSWCSSASSSFAVTHGAEQKQ